MIHIASRVLSDRWTKISFAIVCAAVAIAVATRPAPAKRGRVIVTDTQIEILHDVTFVGDTISTPSLRTLDALAATLEGNHDIRRLEVQANTLAHAQLCVDYLIGRGVEPNRLTTGTKVGPLASFLILERSADYSQP